MVLLAEEAREMLSKPERAQTEGGWSKFGEPPPPEILARIPWGPPERPQDN